jgi:hypothetical protein
MVVEWRRLLIKNIHPRFVADSGTFGTVLPISSRDRGQADCRWELIELHETSIMLWVESGEGGHPTGV